MLRVAILDHHPAVRAGLESILRGSPDIEPVGSAADRIDLWPLLYRTDPRVLVLGQPQRDHGPGLCLRVRKEFPHCRVVLYASGPDVAVPAVFAGAHALVDKAADVRDLVGTVRAVGGGEKALPELTVAMRRRAACRLAPADRAILAMRLAGTAPRDIAATVGITRAELDGRNACILARLAGLAPLPSRVRAMAA